MGEQVFVDAARTAIALLDGGTVRAVTPIPEVDGHVHKVEGLALRAVDGGEVHLLAVVDSDDPDASSAEFDVRVPLS